MTRKSAVASLKYEAPKVFRIRIAGDELAVAGCKTTTSGGGPNPPGCRKSIPACKNAGS